jgi:ABC-2 type transport system permease protein
MRAFSNIWAIVQKELKHYFVSPIAYVVMMIFLTLSGYFLHVNLFRFLTVFNRFKMMMQFNQDPSAMERLNLNELVIAPTLYSMVFVLLFLLPLIMMRSFAEEKKQKTEELLLTSPLTINEILAGKFFGALFFVLIVLLPTAVYQVILFKLSTPELGPVLTGYGSVVLFAGAGVAIGLFASSLTENQIIAAVISFVILLGMFIITSLSLPEGSLLGDIVSYVMIREHLTNLLRGIVDTRDLVYFGSVIFLFLFLTKRSLESVSWR